jgi:hypothetical protein
VGSDLQPCEARRAEHSPLTVRGPKGRAQKEEMMKARWAMELIVGCLLTLRYGADYGWPHQRRIALAAARAEVEELIRRHGWVARDW